MRLTIFLVLFDLLVNAFMHKPWLESFLLAVALAVGLTPELLPMVVSVTLSRGAMLMAKERVILKRLAAIQNLGSMDILCTDKTGTLTEAKIKLERHIEPQGQPSERALELAYLSSFFETGLRSPLDAAILAHQEIDVNAWKKIDEVPFDFERCRLSVLLDKGNWRLLVVKGGAEEIVGLCTRYEEHGNDRSARRQRAGTHTPSADRARNRRLSRSRHRLARSAGGPSACCRRRRSGTGVCRFRRIS
jgi:Mg2+-importing ATPase